MRKSVFLLPYFFIVFSLPSLGQNTIKGVVTHQGEPVSRAKVYIKGYEDDYVLTNRSGKFFLELPEIEIDKLDCYVNPDGTQIRQKYQIPNQSIGHVEFKVNYLKDPRENLIAVKEDTSDKEGKTETKVQPQLVETNKPEEKEPTSVNTEPKKDTTSEEEIPSKEEKPFRLSEETRESLKSDDIQSDIETLANELDKEQKRMIERNRQIKNEIQNITDRLENSVDLTPEKKKVLINQLDDLEEQLSENSKRFTELQDLTLSQIDQMRNQLGDERKKREQFQQIIWILGSILLIVLILLVIVFLIARKIIKQRNQIAVANMKLGDKNKQLEDKNHEIAGQNNQLQEQKGEIEKQNKQLEVQKQEISLQALELAKKNEETKDSIRAAEVIQKSILPPLGQFKNLFSEQFIIYQPKDIVSGDFYWMTRAGMVNLTFIAVVDCTGHGVPGAFMSMIGNSLLNEIVNNQKIYDPAEILNSLQIGLTARLGFDNQDGMDVCLIRVEKTDEENKTIIFCGAKRPLLIYRNQNLENIKGTRKGIGGIEQNSDKEFENLEITLEKGDVMYLTTDGYVDTPGPDRRSFGTRKLLSLLEEIAPKPLDEQKHLLLKNLEEYRQNEEARDDLTFIGLKV